MWVQTSAMLHGDNKKRCKNSINKTKDKNTIGSTAPSIISTGYGGHFRAVQGFKYIGNEGLK